MIENRTMLFTDGQKITTHTQVFVKASLLTCFYAYQWVLYTQENLYCTQNVLLCHCTVCALLSVEYVQCELYALYSHRSLYILCSSVVNYFTYTILSHIEYTGFSLGFFQGIVFMYYQLTKSSVCCKAFLTNQVFTTDNII